MLSTIQTLKYAVLQDQLSEVLWRPAIHFALGMDKAHDSWNLPHRGRASWTKGCTSIELEVSTMRDASQDQAAVTQ